LRHRKKGGTPHDRPDPIQRAEADGVHYLIVEREITLVGCTAGSAELEVIGAAFKACETGGGGEKGSPS
jgi:hypothetical protein